MAQFPARIHVLFARATSYGVVIRRGPAKQVATIGWDRATDTFALGQWLKGRIYERRSDLSPDGKHLIYFAMNGKWDSETQGSWTAISRAPYLKAIALWAKGDCWQGGGLFIDNDSFCINNWYDGQSALITPLNLRLNRTWPFPGGVGAECLGVYFRRLLRDGWRLRGEPGASGTSSADVWVFEKPAPGDWLLRKHAFATLDHPAGKGCYYDRHELLHKASGERIDGWEWEWADVDRQRITWSEAGKLFAAELGPTGLANVREIYDFNPLEFEARAAPY